MKSYKLLFTITILLLSFLSLQNEEVTKEEELLKKQKNAKKIKEEEEAKAEEEQYLQDVENSLKIKEELKKTLLSDSEKEWTKKEAMPLLVNFFTHIEENEMALMKEKYEANQKKFIDDEIAYALSNEFVVTQYVMEEFSKAGKDTLKNQYILDMMDHEKYNDYITSNEEKIIDDTLKFFPEEDL